MIPDRRASIARQIREEASRLAQLADDEELAFLSYLLTIASTEAKGIENGKLPSDWSLGLTKTNVGLDEKRSHCMRALLHYASSIADTPASTDVDAAMIRLSKRVPITGSQWLQR